MARTPLFADWAPPSTGTEGVSVTETAAAGTQSVTD